MFPSRPAKRRKTRLGLPVFFFATGSTKKKQSVCRQPNSSLFCRTGWKHGMVPVTHLYYVSCNGTVQTRTPRPRNLHVWVVGDCAPWRFVGSRTQGRKTPMTGVCTWQASCSAEVVAFTSFSPHPPRHWQRRTFGHLGGFWRVEVLLRMCCVEGYRWWRAAVAAPCNDRGDRALLRAVPDLYSGAILAPSVRASSRALLRKWRRCSRGLSRAGGAQLRAVALDAVQNLRTVRGRRLLQRHFGRSGHLDVG